MIPTVDDDEVFELTNIKVHEVSLVDRAANQRKFVVTKRDKKRSGDPITAEDAAQALEKAQGNFANTPAAELDRKDAQAAEAVKATSAPAIETSVTTEAVETVKAPDVLTAPNPDVSSIVETPAMDAFATKMQAAWLGAIDAVRARLDMMAEEAKMPYGYPSGHIYYLQCMLECMNDIGGAEWDIESAAMNASTSKSYDVTKREGLFKIGKAITASRMSRGQIFEMQKRFEALISAEATKNAPASVETVTTAPVVAVVAAAPIVAAAPVNIDAVVFDITKDPAFKALQESMTSQKRTIESLEGIVGVQEKELAKARSTVRSNALTPDRDTHHNEVKWPRDMAATSKIRSR